MTKAKTPAAEADLPDAPVEAEAPPPAPEAVQKAVVEGAAPDAPDDPAEALPPAPEPEPEPDLGAEVVTLDCRAFPGFILAQGGTARRKGWAPGYELSASAAGGRGGQVMKLYTSGRRGGPIEWRPTNIADELLADDWEMTLTRAQLQAAFDRQNAPDAAASATAEG